MVMSLPAKAGDSRNTFNTCMGNIPWSSEWQLTPVFLPGKSHEQRSLAGYSLWGRKELDLTEHAQSVSVQETIALHLL